MLVIPGIMNEWGAPSKSKNGSLPAVDIQVQRLYKARMYNLTIATNCISRAFLADASAFKTFEAGEY